MKAFWNKKRAEYSRVEDMVDLASQGKLWRRRFVTTLTAMGASATAVATFVVAAEQISQRNHQVTRPANSPVEQQNLQSHDQHLAAQSRSNDPATPTPSSQSDLHQHLDAFMADYHPEAVVEDMLLGGAIQGHAAIRDHKAQEFASLQGVRIDIQHRFAVGNEVVAEWVASGVLNGTFLGITGAQKPFAVRGLTVVTRDTNGQITRESLYYDLSEVERQLGTRTI